jgi:hypothetical protein
MPTSARSSGGCASHHALRGNVETEVAREDSGAAAAAPIPSDVSDAVVSRSNEILARCARPRAGRPEARERLAALADAPRSRRWAMRAWRSCTATRLSLAGWGFASERLADFGHDRWVESMFAQARVDRLLEHAHLPARVAPVRGRRRGEQRRRGHAQSFAARARGSSPASAAGPLPAPRR